MIVLIILNKHVAQSVSKNNKNNKPCYELIQTKKGYFILQEIKKKKIFHLFGPFYQFGLIRSII